MTSFAFRRKVNMTLLFTFAILIISAFVATPQLSAAAESAVTDAQNGNYTTAIVCLAAALAFGFGSLGAGMAISKVGSAAMGAISERPEIASNALIFIALAEGLVVFGFITALMILGKV